MLGIGLSLWNTALSGGGRANLSPSSARLVIQGYAPEILPLRAGAAAQLSVSGHPVACSPVPAPADLAITGHHVACSPIPAAAGFEIEGYAPEVTGAGLSSPLGLGAACVEWWDFRTGGTGAAIASHAGEKGALTLTQASGTLRPVWHVDGYCVFDASDDYLTFTLPTGVTAGQLWVETTNGWYKSSIGNLASGTHRISCANLRQLILVNVATITQQQIDLLTAYMSGTQYGCIFKTLDTTIYSRIDNTPDVNYTITYIGANGLTYSLASSQTGATVNISAQGLTAPVVVQYGLATLADATMISFDISSNQYIGPLPDISGLTNLVTWSSSGNKNNGSLPDVSELTKLVNWFINSNQHTGVTFTSVPATLLTFRAENNLFTASDVNQILAAFVVAGSAAGTLNVGGTGNAAPTGQGLVDKATLQGLGWTVTTN